MKEIRFKLNNNESFNDLMKRIEEEMPQVNWYFGEKPALVLLDELSFPCSIIIKDNILSFDLEVPHIPPSWQIGQSLFRNESTALEDLISIPQNQDGSITISPELQAKLVVALRENNQ